MPVPLRALYPNWCASQIVAADGVTVNGALPGRHATPRIEQLDRGTAERTGRTLEEVRAAMAV